MHLLIQIRQSDKKAKELASLLAKTIQKKKPSVSEFSQSLEAGTDVEICRAIYHHGH